MVFFIFIQILKENSVANSGDAEQTQRSAASALGLHCLHMPHKKGARLGSIIGTPIIVLLSFSRILTYHHYILIECKSLAERL